MSGAFADDPILYDFDNWSLKSSKVNKDGEGATCQRVIIGVPSLSLAMDDLNIREQAIRDASLKVARYMVCVPEEYEDTMTDLLQELRQNMDQVAWSLQELQESVIDLVKGGKVKLQTAIHFLKMLMRRMKKQKKAGTLMDSFKCAQEGIHSAKEEIDRATDKARYTKTLVHNLYKSVGDVLFFNTKISRSAERMRGSASKKAEELKSQSRTAEVCAASTGGLSVLGILGLVVGAAASAPVAVGVGAVVGVGGMAGSGFAMSSANKLSTQSKAELDNMNQAEVSKQCADGMDQQLSKDAKVVESVEKAIKFLDMSVAAICAEIAGFEEIVMRLSLDLQDYEDMEADEEEVQECIDDIAACVRKTEALLAAYNHLLPAYTPGGDPAAVHYL